MQGQEAVARPRWNCAPIILQLCQYSRPPPTFMFSVADRPSPRSKKRPVAAGLFPFHSPSLSSLLNARGLAQPPPRAFYHWGSASGKGVRSCGGRPIGGIVPAHGEWSSRSRLGRSWVGEKPQIRARWRVTPQKRKIAENAGRELLGRLRFMGFQRG